MSVKNIAQYKIGQPMHFSRKEKEELVLLLIKQGKVRPPDLMKLERCHLLCSCQTAGKIIAMGAIKPKTASVFHDEKSGETQRENDFDWELGYFYTEPAFRRKGISTTIITELLKKYGNQSLMASTEIADDNPMKCILERLGFKTYGKHWKSILHNGKLGLYLFYPYYNG